MMESPEREDREEPGRTTSPDESTHEPTTPPGNRGIDEDAVDDAEEALDQQSAGH
jgi:hypothetical protein